MDLVLLVCLVTSPQTCREERIVASLELSDPRMCMMGAAPTIAEWTEGNPEWSVTRWTCGAPGGARLTRNFN